ncbi:MAG TPA: hypothetical protein PLX06_14475 [Fimbriimonadaceae bacterium]|nr:hypothetical protein [Fimbriimonadaceae bacterium]
MKNVTISMDEDLLLRSREFAQANGTTLNELIRNLLRRTVIGTEVDWTEGFLRVAEEVKGDSKGWKWNRSEIQRG